MLETPRVPAWRVFRWVKLIEAVLQLRPRALRRMWLQPDPDLRHAQRWYTAMGRAVWLREWRDAVLFRTRPGPTVAAFWGADQLPENALVGAKRPREATAAHSGAGGFTPPEPPWDIYAEKKAGRGLIAFTH